jgi:hypothetical protein
VDTTAAAVIAEELTAPLSAIEDRDQADITPAEFDRAMAAYWNIHFMSAAYRRGQLH